MKTAMVASVMVILAGSAAHAFSDYFVVSGQKMIRQKSISAYNTLSTEDLRGAGRKPPAGRKPYTEGEKSLFQRLLRWE
jgi:hypothetical protein